MKTLTEHWEDVPKNWRHIGTIKSKKDRLVYNYNEYLLKNLNTDEIKNSLDWGCGGGILTKELKKISNTSVVDISPDSLESCLKYANPDYNQLIPSNLDDFSWGGPDIDFVLCHALVWHFPSLEYFKKVLNIWKNLSPKYIAFNTKVIKGGYKETDDYSSDYLNALLLSDSKVEKMLKEIGYEVNSKSLVTTGVQNQTYFSFVKK